MIEACKTFLIERLKEILLEDLSAPYTDDNIFFGNMDRDYLKDHDYAANCLILQDRKKKDGSIVGRERNLDNMVYTLTRRRFERRVLIRCFTYAGNFAALWGNAGYEGLVDQLEQKTAEASRGIADSQNRAIRIELHDAVRPWGAEEAGERLKRRPHQAICRMEFTGGIYTTWTVPIVPSVSITPSYQ